MTKRILIGLIGMITWSMYAPNEGESGHDATFTVIGQVHRLGKNSPRAILWLKGANGMTFATFNVTIVCSGSTNMPPVHDSIGSYTQDGQTCYIYLADTAVQPAKPHLTAGNLMQL